MKKIHNIIVILALAYIGLLVIREAEMVAGSVVAFFISVLSLFEVVIIAFVVAYLLDPAVDFFQNKWVKRSNEKRMMGTVAVYSIMITLFLVIVLFITFKFNDISYIDEISEMINKLGDGIVRVGIALASLNVMEYAADFISHTSENISLFLNQSGGKITEFLVSAGSHTADFFIGMVVAFYFLVNKKQVKEKIKSVSSKIIPKKAMNMIITILGDLDASFSGYLRGQLMDALFIGVLFSIYLSVIGVKFGIIIGIASGLANFIPYLGSIVCFVLAVTAAFFSGELKLAIYATVGIIILQIIDGTFIAPRLIGKGAKLSPAAVIIALSVFGKLMGLTGMIIAVPVCGTLKIIYERKVEFEIGVMDDEE